MGQDKNREQQRGRRGGRQPGANLLAPAQQVADVTALHWWRYRHCFLEAKRLAVEERLKQRQPRRASATDARGLREATTPGGRATAWSLPWVRAFDGPRPTTTARSSRTARLAPAELARAPPPASGNPRAPMSFWWMMCRRDRPDHLSEATA